MEPGFWDYHDMGSATCDACAVDPVSCDCGEGLIHTQFREELDALEGRCDGCQATTPSPAEVNDDASEDQEAESNTTR